MRRAFEQLHLRVALHATLPQMATEISHIDALLRPVYSETNTLTESLSNDLSSKDLLGRRWRANNGLLVQRVA